MSGPATGTARASDPVWLIDPAARGAAIPPPEQVGLKAHNLMRMARLGVPVPPALVLGVDLCVDYLSGDGQRLGALLRSQMRGLEAASGLAFGSPRRPLLVSVRSGAAASMPGALESVLNVGLTETTLRGLLRLHGNPRLAWDCYRRLVQTYAEVVRRCPSEPFERALQQRLAAEGAERARDLDATALGRLATEFLTLYRSLAGAPFPQDPWEQLEEATAAVFRSWNAPKAVVFRDMSHVAGVAGTAVTIQTMVFGNAGGTSGSGVGFTRDPATGENRLYADFLFNAQGEDVVSGRQAIAGSEALGLVLPAVRDEIIAMLPKLEAEFGDAQDFEFTVEEGRLYLLQTRTGKRTPWAALRIAVDMVTEGLITPSEALRRLEGLDLMGLERRRLRPGPGVAPLARGTPAGLGAATGVIALSANRARELAAAGTSVILVRRDIATTDIVGINAAAGVLTALGGRTSHAAVIARQLDKVCVVGCAEMIIDPDGTHATLAGRRFAEGDALSLDGDCGAVYSGILPVERERPEAELSRVDAWRAAIAATPTAPMAATGLMR